jgi:DNA (cytosine-5)-methyltransferase 1
MKYLSVCSGIEAASKAWEPIGWEPVAFSEIEPFPSAVLKHHWPKVPNLGDMSKYEQWNIQSGSVDLLVGGTPCQSFSVAGLRQGLKDPRGNLMLTYLAIAERFKPRWLVWENVPGVLSSNGGKDFGSFLGALGELGYVDWAYRVLDAQWFGVAQRRRRVFVVAHLGEGNLAAKVLFESESVCRNTPTSRKAGQRIATDVDARAGSSESVGAFRMQAFGEYADDGTASAMKARDYKDATDLVAEPVAYNITFCDANGVRSDRPDGGLYVNKTDVTNSLTRAGIGTNVVQPHAVAISGAVAGTLDANYYKGCGSANYGEREVVAVDNSTDRMAVRRLTPRECERLQGFNDDHTMIPWRNKPANQCPDGPRYKALGNSMAVPCMAWIGKRIDAVEKSK